MKLKFKIITSALLAITVSASFIILNNHKETSVRTTIDTNYDWVSYSNTPDLVKASDVIVIGEVVKDKEQKEKKLEVKLNENISKEEKEKILNTPPTEIVTASQIKVSKIVKGNIDTGNNITIEQLGGIFKDIEQNVKNVRYFNKGDKAIFFLMKTPEPNVYVTLNPVQGHIFIEKGMAKPHIENKLFSGEMDENSMIEKITKYTSN